MMTQPTHRWWLLLLMLLAFGVFWPLLGAEFLTWDDLSTVAGNPDFSPPTLAGIARYFLAPHNDLYIPLTYTAWGAIASIAQVDTPGEGGTLLNSYLFHAANLAVHLGTGLMAFAILRRLFANPFAAWAGAALVLLHPLQVEAVAWVSGMKDLLSGLLALTAIWLHLVAISARSPRHRTLLAAASLAAFVLAMLAKPSAIATPLVIGAIDLFLLHRPLRSTLLWAILGLFLAAPIVYIGLQAQPAHVLAYHPAWFLRPLIAGDALAFYLYKLLWPAALAVDYGRSPQWLIDAGRWSLYSLAWLTPLALLTTAWLLRRRFAPATTAVAVVVAALLPVLGLLSFDFQYYSTTADHYVYVAMLGPAILLAALLQRNTGRPWQIATVCLIFACAARSHLQTYFWQDSTTLFAHTLQVNPTSIAGAVGVGNWHYDHGQPQEALPYYDLALRTAPYDTEALDNRGNVLTSLGDYPAAIAAYRQALQRKPECAKFHYDLANALQKSGQSAEAESAYRQALRLNPDYAQAWTNLGALYLQSGNLEQARDCFAKATQLNPQLAPAARGLAITLDRIAATRPARE